MEKGWKILLRLFRRCAAPWTPASPPSWIFYWIHPRQSRPSGGFTEAPQLEKEEECSAPDERLSTKNLTTLRRGGHSAHVKGGAENEVL